MELHCQLHYIDQVKAVFKSIIFAALRSGISITCPNMQNVVSAYEYIDYDHSTHKLQFWS